MQSVPEESLSDAAEAATDRSYAAGIVMCLVAGVCWSFMGLFVRLIETADAWQILFYRSLALVGFLAALPLLVIVALLVSSGSTALLVVGIVIAVVGFALISVVMTALNAIFQTALYMYATTGETPSAFRGTGLPQTFQTR